jgi:hypothetical protein
VTGRDYSRGGAGPEEENGRGWGGLVASRAEIRAEQQQAKLEHEARYGREMAQRLDEVMRKHREGHRIDYSDLLHVRGDV